MNEARQPQAAHAHSMQQEAAGRQEEEEDRGMQAPGSAISSGSIR